MTIDSGEYKSTVGLKDLHIAEVTADTAAAYTTETPEILAPAVSASMAAAVNVKTQYADDQAFETMSSEGETKIELEVTNVPLSVLAAITGRVFDAASGIMYDNAGTAPYYALSFRSEKSNGHFLYLQYLKGRFSISSKEMASKTDSPEPKTTKITFTAVKTVHQFQLDVDTEDGVKAVVGDEDATGFDGDEWFDAVQTPPEIGS